MIIPNGFIEMKRKTGGGIDPETGYPVPCQYSANSHNWLGRVDGEHFTTAQYTVLIDLQPLESEQIRLSDRAGNAIGEFSIMEAEPLEAVCQLRILV